MTARNATFFTQNAGPIQLASGRLDVPLLVYLEALWIDSDLATDGENLTQISNEYGGARYKTG